MSESLTQLLLRLSEAGIPAILPGDLAKPHFGWQFQSFLNRRLIIEQSLATEWSTCDACECGLFARPVRNVDGRLLAPCPLDATSDVDLEENDLRMFEIDPAAIVTEIAFASNFGTEPEEVIDGVWFMGRSPPGRAIFATLSHAADLQSALTTILKATAGDAPITIIAPELTVPNRRRFAEAGIHRVIFGDVLRAEGPSPFALDLALLVPKTGRGPRLVVQRMRKAVLVDGAERLIPEQPFKLLELLVEKVMDKGGFATNSEIENHLWGRRVHQVIRPVRDVVRDLRSALRGTAKAEPDAGGLIETGNASRGYRLRLKPEEIAIDA